MKRIASWLVVALITFGLIAWVVLHEMSVKKSEADKARQQAEEQEQFDKNVNAFASSHNAVTDWQKTLCEGKARGQLFSSDLEGVLIRADDRPLLIFARLVDTIHAKDGAYIAVVRTRVCGSSTMNLRLTMDAKLMEKTQENRNEPLRYFAMVVRISNVGKMPIQTAGSSAVDASENNADQYAAEGTLTDALFAGVEGLLREFDHKQ